MNLFILLLLLSSCNFFKTVTGAKPDIDKGFAETYKDLTTNLIGFWRFEENNKGVDRVDSVNGLKLIDNTSLAFVGSITNVAGVRGLAIDCNAVSSADHFLSTTFVKNYSEGNHFATSFWLYKIDNGSPAFETIFEFLGQNGLLFLDLGDLDAENDLIDVIVGTPFESVMFEDAVDFTGGSWNHFAINYLNNQQKIELYINGKQFGMMDVTAPFALNSEIIGLCSSMGNAGLKGQLDSFGLWSRSLSASEVESLYNGKNSLD